jgi:hypothetical protein
MPPILTGPRSSPLAIAIIAAAVFLGFPIEASPQSASPTQAIPLTNVQMALPDGWKVANASTGPPGPVLKHLSNPQYELQIRQNGPNADAHSCMNMIGSMKAFLTSAELRPRPLFIPDMYVGIMLEVPKAQLTCVNTGDSVIAVMIFLPSGESKPQVFTELLRQFGNAALKQSNAVKGPGHLRLPSLATEMQLPSGTWAVQEIKDQSGTDDLISRQGGGGIKELEITPMIKTPARCESLMAFPKDLDTTKQKVVQNPAYVGPGWYPVALVQYPPPLKSLQAYTCRNIGNKSVLFTRIDYEGENLDGADEQIVKQMLINVGEAVQRTRSSH